MSKYNQSNKNIEITNNILHYGALIYILFLDENNKEFLVSSEGFTKSKIRLKTKDFISERGIFRENLFRVYPFIF